MMHFQDKNQFLFFTLTGAVAFLIGLFIYPLAIHIQKTLLKNWRIQSWQCLYPEYEISQKIENTQKLSTFILLASCSTLLSALIVKQSGYHYKTGINLILIEGLLLLACLDFKYYLLPDCLTLPLLWLGLFCNTFNLFVPIYIAVWGSMIGYLSLWLIAAAFKYFRGLDGMGKGDFKLFALFGAWWGFSPLPTILMMASVAGISVGFIQILRGRHNLKKPLAFGPYLILSAFIYLIARV